MPDISPLTFLTGSTVDSTSSAMDPEPRQDGEWVVHARRASSPTPNEPQWLTAPLPPETMPQTDQAIVVPRAGPPSRRSEFSSLLDRTVPNLNTVQVWEGTVVKVDSGRFIATLIDKTNPENPDSQAVFDQEEVSPADRELIAEGATFYWFLGKLQSQAGQQTNASMIRFRRLPRWSRTAVRRAEERGRELWSLFGEDA